MLLWHIPADQALHPVDELGKSVAPAANSMPTTSSRFRLCANMRGVSLLPSLCSVVFDNVSSCEITGCKFCMQESSEPHQPQDSQCARSERLAQSSGLVTKYPTAACKVGQGERCL